MQSTSSILRAFLAGIAALVAALFVQPAVWAAPGDLNCPQFMPVPFSSISGTIDPGNGNVITASRIGCGAVGDVAQVIANIKGFLGKELGSPRSIDLKMVDTMDNAFFSPEEHALEVPFQLLMGEYTKHPNFTHPVWAHEYGHSVFEANLITKEKQWQSMMAKMLGRPANSELVGRAMEFMVTPYNEFFADVIGVLYSGQGDALYRALYMTGWVTNPNGKPGTCVGPQCRERNSKVDPRVSLSNRNFLETKNTLDRWRPVAPDDVHNLLGPTRVHVWKYHLSTPGMSTAKGAMARAVLIAIVSEIDRRMATLAKMGKISTATLEQELSLVKEINQSLMDAIDRSFAQARMP